MRSTPEIDQMSKVTNRYERWQRRKAIAERVLNCGVRPEEVAVEFGVSVATVHSATKENFEVTEPPQEPPSRYLPKGRLLRDEVMAILLEIVNGGENTEIAEKHGVSRQYVDQIRQQAKKVGFEIASRSDKLKADREKIAQEAKSGMSASKIAKKFNVHPSHVYRIFEEFGIESSSVNRTSISKAIEVVGDMIRGKSDEEIVKKRGVTDLAVARIRSKAKRVRIPGV